MMYGLSVWLSGLIRFLSHSTCWAYLAGDLQRPGIKSRSRHELSVGWTNGRYAMRLISRTGTEAPSVSSLNCDRCRLWSYDITAGYKCEYSSSYYYYYKSRLKSHLLHVADITDSNDWVTSPELSEDTHAISAVAKFLVNSVAKVCNENILGIVVTILLPHRKFGRRAFSVVVQVPVSQVYDINEMNWNCLVEFRFCYRRQNWKRSNFIFSDHRSNGCVKWAIWYQTS